MVDFYAVYDAVGDFGGWEHYTTDAEDGYCDWLYEVDHRFEMIFYNWDVDRGEEPCGLRVVDNLEKGDDGYALELGRIVLEGEHDIEGAVRRFLEEIEEEL